MLSRSDLMIKKPLSSLLSSDRGDGEVVLHRALGAIQLIALGIGCIVGAGLFSLTGPAAALYAGPGVVLSYVLAAIACVLAGICYAEFASVIPVAGSCYTYAYATMGELVAWIIGWDLILEYAVGASTVASSWSRYFVSLMGDFGIQVPMGIAAGPWDTVASGHGGINLVAVCIVLILGGILIIGIKESARFNAVIVGIKLSVIIMFIAIGWGYMDSKNHTPFIPPNTTGVFGEFGWSGVLRAAGVIFFAFIGFDAVSTAAQEAQNPQRTVPIGIIGSLAICTVVYVLFSYVLTGMVHYSELNNPASVATAINKTPYLWLRVWVKIAILAGYSSVMLVLMLGQARIFFAMARDGLLPPLFSVLHPRFRTPARSTIVVMSFVATLAAFFPMNTLGHATSIGTLFAFIIVCIGVIVLRRTDPDLERGFRTPLVPVLPICGVIANAILMYSLGLGNWIRLFLWMAIGLAVFFGYSRHHSVLRRQLGNISSSDMGNPSPIIVTLGPDSSVVDHD